MDILIRLLRPDCLAHRRSKANLISGIENIPFYRFPFQLPQRHFCPVRLILSPTLGVYEVVYCKSAETSRLISQHLYLKRH